MAIVTPKDILAEAAQAVGFDGTDATIIRDGSNVMLRMAHRVVARIGPRGTRAEAARQVQVSRWLTKAGLPVVTALDGVQQPTMVDEWPVTWWELLPEHRSGTPAELGATLRSLHALPAPKDIELPIYDPFAGIDQRIGEATALRDDDKAWLVDRLDQLQDQYQQAAMQDARRVIHGDAWQGNVAVPESAQPILVDLEHVSLGHPDWDLIPIAVDYKDFPRLRDEDYESFAAAYGGHDVTATSGFRTMADIQELRWVCFVLSKIGISDHAAQETQHRIACLRGEVPRPWTWTAF